VIPFGNRGLRARAALLCAVAFLALTALSTNAAEPPILACTLDRIETVTPDAKRTLTPMLSLEGKPMTSTLIVTGLGTRRVTAKGTAYTLALGDRILPMPPAPGQEEDENDWFYARSKMGVTVLQIPKLGRPRVEVRLHNLGVSPYSFVGRCQ
jgi:hypothetical protein